MDDCWNLGLAPDDGLGGLGGTTFGWKFAPTATGSDGTTPVVFDHVNLSNVAPMQPVLAGQTTAGTPGYCGNGERGIQQNGGDITFVFPVIGGDGYQTPNMPPWNGPGYPNASPAYQVYVNPVTGVGMDATFQGVYAPAYPDTSPPQITFSKYFDCQTFEQNSTTGSTDGAVGGSYDFSCTDPGFGLVFGPTGIRSCTATVNGTPVLNGATIDTSTRGHYTLAVTAVDNAGNPHTRSVKYKVVSSDGRATALRRRRRSRWCRQRRTGTTAGTRARSRSPSVRATTIRESPRHGVRSIRPPRRLSLTSARAAPTPAPGRTCRAMARTRCMQRARTTSKTLSSR